MATPIETALVSAGVAFLLATAGCQPRQDTGGIPGGVLTPGPQDVVHVRILTMTDLHGALDSKTYPETGDRMVGGVAVLKSAMDSAEAQCACPTLRIDAGDQMQGTLPSNLFFGASTVQALNLLGLDAAAIGNHDLDWSVDTLQQRISEAQYPWLAANVFDSISGGRPEWARPYHILEVSGLRVAVIGYITSTAKRIIYAPRTAGLTFGQGRAAIEDVLEEVRAQSPDLTILTAHAGWSCTDEGCSGEILSLARELGSADVDLILAGHLHRTGTTVVSGIPIIQAGANGKALGIADLYRTEGGHWRADLAVRTVFADEVTPDASIIGALQSYRRASDSLANRTIATLQDAPARRDGERELGNIIADALRDAAQADIAFIGNGGIRSTLAAGPVTYGMLYAVMPFGNQLMRLTISGRDLRLVLEQGLGRVHVSGLQIRYDPAGEAGSRIVDMHFADGRSIADDSTYTIAVDSYLAAGGSGFSIFRNLPRKDMGMKSLDALIAHLQEAPQPFTNPHDTRVVKVP